VGIAAVALIVSACGGGSSGGGGTAQKGNTGFKKISANQSGTPTKGGTLNVLGTGDVDYLDPNISYYTIGYSVARLYSRQLYSYPAELGKQTQLRNDIATGNPEVSSDGLTYKVTIKQGVKWNTSPARQVTAADAVRGLKSTCNPSTPFGGQGDYAPFIVGYKDFCDGFSKVQPNASAIAKYMEGTDLPGATVDPSDPQTVVYKLTQPATFFPNMLALPAFSPRAKEMNAYVPASAQEAQHTISDGPYQVQSYNPAHTLVLTRNSAWDASTDSLRKAYVDKIVITQTGNQDSITQQLQTNTPSADLGFDVGPSSTDAVQLLNANNPQLNVESEIASNPYVLFNTQSPNNNGALGKVQVRQALSYALNRANLIQVAGGPKLNPALTHVLPPQILGSKDFELYPHDIAKAKSMLQAAGASNLKLVFLFRPESSTSQKMFQTVQNDLKAVGVTVTGRGVPNADFYTKYLSTRARPARASGTCRSPVGVRTGTATPPCPSSARCSTAVSCRRTRATSVCSTTRRSTRSSTRLRRSRTRTRPWTSGARPTVQSWRGPRSTRSRTRTRPFCTPLRCTTTSTCRSSRRSTTRTCGSSPARTAVDGYGQKLRSEQ